MEIRFGLRRGSNVAFANTGQVARYYDTAGNETDMSTSTVADGADVAQGSTSDAAYNGTINRTVISYLRAIANKSISAAAQLVSSTQLPAALGQTTMVNSLPVTIASNQTPLLVANTIVYSGAAASDYGLLTVGTAAVNSFLVAKTSAGNFYGCNLISTVDGYIYLFDAVAAPVDGNVTPKKVWKIAANQVIEISYNPPIRCSTGITISLSTTGPFIKTASSSAFISVDYV